MSNLIKVRQMETIQGEAVCLDELVFKDTLDVLNEFRSSFEGRFHIPGWWRKSCKSSNKESPNERC